MYTRKYARFIIVLICTTRALKGTGDMSGFKGLFIGVFPSYDFLKAFFNTTGDSTIDAHNTNLDLKA